MKIQTKRKLIALLAVLLVSISISAQDPRPSDEMLIKSLRASIQVMVENAPDSDAPDAKDFARRLGSLRSQLLMSLAKKTGALEVRIHNLDAPGVLPEVQAHAQQLRQELKEVETEIGTVESAMRTNGGVVLIPNLPQPPKPKAHSPASPLTKTQGQKDFEAQVASISSDQMEKAAIPAVAKAPLPTCNENGRPATTTFSKLDEAICGLARDISDPDIREIDLENDQANLMTILIAQLLKAKDPDGESYSAFVTEAQEMRLDQQMGAGPTNHASTSLVSKGGIPYLLGFAVENGAAQESTKDTSITFRINPGGVINTLAGKGFITGFQSSEDDPALKFLRKTSVGLTFDTSRGNTPGTFTGSRQQLSQISARFEFINDRDPRQRRYATQWQKLVADEGVKLAAQTWKTTSVLTNWAGTGDITFIDPALQAWLNETNKRVALVKASLSGVARFDAVAAVISEQASQLPVNLVSKKVVDTLTDFARESKTYSKAKNDLLDTIARGKVFTLDYTNTRNVNAPDTSNFNFIASTGTTARIDLTANGSFTIFHQRPAATSLTARRGRIRDFQFAAQLAVPFKVGDAQFDFWFSGRYERLLADASTFSGATMPGTKGDIAVGQFGFNIPIKGLGVKFPVSLTFANRTELVKEKEVRGNFGFTFNWDTLLSKLKPF